MENETKLGNAFKRFLEPPLEFAPMPFWFWNDDLERAELIRQVRAFREAQFGGFVIHARVGLSRRIGYLTETYFRLVRRVVEEAARCGMKVILYDEGSYPSGSAQGAVVAENPEYASVGPSGCGRRRWRDLLPVSGGRIRGGLCSIATSAQCSLVHSAGAGWIQTPCRCWRRTLTISFASTFPRAGGRS